MLEKIVGIFRRSKKEEEKIEDTVEDVVEEIVEKVKRAEGVSDENPWEEFKALCKEVGADYREVISKAAWKYIKDTGGIEEDPISQAKEIANILKELNQVIESVSEPESIKKVKIYKEGIKSVAELKSALKELKSEKLSPSDMLAILKKIGIM